MCKVFISGSPSRGPCAFEGICRGLKSHTVLFQYLLVRTPSVVAEGATSGVHKPFYSNRAFFRQLYGAPCKTASCADSVLLDSCPVESDVELYIPEGFMTPG